METYVLIGVVIFLGALYVWEKIHARKERADLITRIMANSLTDYAKNVIRITEENKNMSVEEIMEQISKDRVPI